MKKINFLGFSILLLSITFACNNSVEKASEEEMEPAVGLDTLTIALDWRPNVLHSGVFYAQAQELYKNEGIYLKWFTPEVDDYTVKPLKKLLAGEADMSVGPSEHLFHYAIDTVTKKPKAQAIATLLQQDMSAFIAKESSSITRPADFEGKTYLGYQTPLENEILKSMIRFDGGNPMFKVEHPGRLAVWSGFENNTGDFAWVFMHWEAALANKNGIATRAFKPIDYGVPYGYSSVIMAQKDLSPEKEDAIKRFLIATKKGYQAMVAMPNESLGKVFEFIEHKNFDDTVFATQAQKIINPAYFNDSTSWGEMNVMKWTQYLNWMQENKLLDYESIKGIKAEEFFTNKYLPAK